jgi:hypothetical protein
MMHECSKLSHNVSMIAIGSPIILQRNIDWISWLITDETICSNPAQPGDQTTYLRPPAPVVLDLTIAPNLVSRQIKSPITYVVFVVPRGLSRTLHMLQDTLQEVVSKKFIEWSQVRVRNMIKLESQTMHIVMVLDERSDFIIILQSGK